MSEVQYIQRRGLRCALHVWRGSVQCHSVAVIFHGFAAHAHYPTVRYAIETLTSAGFACVCLDLPGHGESEGPRGYIDSAETVIEDGLAAVDCAMNNFPGLPVLLVGSSLGGAIAMRVSLHRQVSGLILLAPMLAIKVHYLLRCVLRLLALTPLRGIPLIKSSSTSAEAQYKDPERRMECANDPLSYSGKLAPATAWACVDLALSTQAQLGHLTAPYLLLIAGDDVVVDNRGADLLEASASAGETHRFAGALHGLLCEPAASRREIEKTIKDWALARTGALGAAGK